MGDLTEIRGLSIHLAGFQVGVARAGKAEIEDGTHAAGRLKGRIS
jgi:hypothetical protein